MNREPPSGFIRGLPGPASELPWSADFVMQAIEVLAVMRRDDGLLWLKPGHADSFVVGWPAGANPEEVALNTLKGLAVAPTVLHSTSWRHSNGEVVLTYLAVVPAETAMPDSWELLPVGHADLARGGAVTPPTAIDITQVIEHALRHLAWLFQEDQVIAGLLPGWEETLAAYVPEPFRALGGPIPGAG